MDEYLMDGYLDDLIGTFRDSGFECDAALSGRVHAAAHQKQARGGSSMEASVTAGLEVLARSVGG